MRHFFCLTLSPAALSLCVGMATAKAGLVTLSGGLHAAAAHFACAVVAAIALTAVAVATQDDGCVAAGAQVASRWGFHRQIGPTGLG
jgi:hypothetical protein